MDGKLADSSKLKFYELRKYQIEGFKDEIDNRPGSLATSLITVANRHRFVVVACNDMTVKGVNIDSLFNYDWSKSVINETVKLENFDFVCKLNFNASLVSISNHGYGSILMCIGQTGQYNSPIIELFNLDMTPPTQSFFTIAQPEMTNVRVVDISWHPVYYDSIVALCTNDGRLLVLAIDEARKKANFVYKSSHYGALSCCWSPKGKHLVVGRQDGKIFRLEYEVSKTEFKFKEVDKSIQSFNSYSKVKPDHQVVKVRWISKGILLVVLARPVPDQRETIYSIVSVRAGKPFYCWSQIINEAPSAQEYQVHIVNLTNAVVCGSSASPEAAFFSRDDNCDSTQDPSDWRVKNIVLSSNPNHSNASLLRGLAMAYGIGLVDSPLLLYITSSGTILPCYTKDEDNFSFAIPNVRERKDCPFNWDFINEARLSQPPDRQTVEDILESSSDSSDTEDYCSDESDSYTNSDQSLGGFEEACNGEFMEEDDSSDEDSIHERFRDVDVENADFKTIWSRLSEDERKEFKDLVANGDIYKYVPQNDN